ncbi:MAG: glycoside hydrolase family 127 protein [Cyclobacteriaceae bacterium]
MVLFRRADVIIGLIMLLLASCQSKEKGDALKVTPFELNQVKLLDGPFKHATALNKEVLLNYEPDRFLAKYRIEAGLKPKAENYNGWEDNTIAGQSVGHYLSAISMMYQTTGDDEFKKHAAYIVDELAECQSANGGGYIGAIPGGRKIFEEQVAKGDIRSQGFDLNGLWSPFYNYHKMMAGLRDAYHLLGIEKALSVEKGFADWVASIISPLNDDQLQKMLACEYGGMNEVLADLYADTKEDKYMDLSRAFYQKVVLDSIALGKDVLSGLHANTQIPKFIGLARDYELTQNEKAKQSATFFWNRVVNHHSYVTGGNGNHEYFGPPDQLRNRLSDGTTETCNVYNMLKLTNHVFEWEPTAEAADFYERALFNHILSTQNPENGKVIYNLSLEMGGNKYFQDYYAFTCCVDSGMETHAKYGGSIYFHNDDELYINQFIASEVNWNEKGLVFRQTTDFPKEQGTTISFEAENPQTFDLKIRYPYWAENGMRVKVNGDQIRVDQQPSSFVSIHREWRTGDKVEVEFPFTIRTESMPDDENRLAILYGPLVMAGILGPKDDPKATEIDYVPIFLTENRDAKNWVNPTDVPNEFKVVDVSQPRDFVLKPFYEVYDNTYSVYWDVFNEASWKEHKESFTAELERKKKLEERTFDFVQPGEMQPERDHNFTGDSVYIETMKDRKARVANRGGWFSFDMKVMTGQPMALVVEYWGGYTGGKTFDIYVDDQKIATENISGKKDGEFIDIQYNIPEALTLSTNIITVKFMGHVGHRTGPVFGIRTIKR